MQSVLMVSRACSIPDMCTPSCLTGHLDPPSEPVGDGVSVRVRRGVLPLDSLESDQAEGQEGHSY